MKSRYNRFIFKNEEGVNFEATATEGKTFEVSRELTGEVIVISEIPMDYEHPEVPHKYDHTKRNWYKKFIFKNGEHVTFEVTAPNSRIFEVSTGITGEIIISTIITMNYEHPPIPTGYKYIEGEWYDGFVIQRIDDKSEFVWIPVGFLDANGTLDGENFNEKLGRRKYSKYDDFSIYGWNEKMTDKLRSQYESVKKYGGFYISRYTISENYRSIKGAKPRVGLTFARAEERARNFEFGRLDVQSHLPYGCEYDSVLEWFIKSGARTVEEVVKDSTNWGNYWNAEDFSKVIKTGLREKWCTNRIYDFAGNVAEWTQEKYSVRFGARVTRGGSCGFSGFQFPAADRRDTNLSVQSGDDIGFRIVLSIQ